MLHLPRTVSRRISMAVATVDTEARVEAELRYDPSDPFAVTLVLCPDAERPVRWVISRELLTDGLRQPAGLGDVRIEPTREKGRQVLLITLSTDTIASLATPAEHVAGFLVETFTVVPTGTETDGLDLDAELAALLD